MYCQSSRITNPDYLSVKVLNNLYQVRVHKLYVVCKIVRYHIMTTTFHKEMWNLKILICNQYYNGHLHQQKQYIIIKNNNHLIIWCPLCFLNVCVIVFSKVWIVSVVVYYGGQAVHDRPKCPQYGHNTQSQRYGYLHVDPNRDKERCNLQCRQ